MGEGGAHGWTTFREGDGPVFQRVTGGLRKPIARFGLPSGRRLELLGFHLEPAWAYGGESPRPVAEEVARRLCPDERPVFVGPAQADGPAWLCVAYLYSDMPARAASIANYSALVLCGLVPGIDPGVRQIVCGLLARVDWEAVATDDFLW